MKARILAAIIATLAISSTAYAATAFWTGRQHLGPTGALFCEYRYAGTTFWQMANLTCPVSVEVP